MDRRVARIEARLLAQGSGPPPADEAERAVVDSGLPSGRRRECVAALAAEFLRAMDIEHKRSPTGEPTGHAMGESFRGAPL